MGKAWRGLGVAIIGILFTLSIYADPHVSYKHSLKHHSKIKKIKKLNHHKKINARPRTHKHLSRHVKHISKKHKHHHYHAYSHHATSHVKAINQPAVKLTSINENDYFINPAEQQIVTRMNQVLRNLRYTRYQMGGDEFDVRRGVYTLDCSHYVDHIVATSSPKAFASVSRWSGTSKPVSRDYFAFFHQIPFNQTQRGWLRVKETQNLLPGDIIVYRSPSMGHMMIVAGKPLRDRYFDDVFYLRVSDSASSGHSNDTRGAHHSGVGIGTLLMKVDPETGEPYQYAWKEGAHWQGINIAMGRPIE